MEDDLVVVERSGRGGQIAGFLLGLAVGAGVALLFAPQSGARTRADIARRARRARRTAMNAADDLRDRAGELYGSARNEVRRRVRNVRDSVDDVIEEVKTSVEAGKEAGVAGARAAKQDLQRRLAEVRGRDGEEA